MENGLTKNGNNKIGKDNYSIMSVIVFLALTIPFFQVDFFVDTVGVAGKIYSGCQILAGISVFLLMLKDRMLKKLSPILLLFAGFCCVHVVIFTHLPVTADRSITVFMASVHRSYSRCISARKISSFVSK